MGLTTWKNAPHGKVLKSDVTIAKNYLNQAESEKLNRLVGMFIDFAEMRALGKKLMTMADWLLQVRRFLDAIRDTLTPPAITKAQFSFVYAEEADLLNVALFGQTARQWRDTHPAAVWQRPRPRHARTARRPHQSRKCQLTALLGAAPVLNCWMELN